MDLVLKDEFSTLLERILAEGEKLRKIESESEDKEKSLTVNQAIFYANDKGFNQVISSYQEAIKKLLQ